MSSARDYIAFAERELALWPGASMSVESSPRGHDKVRVTFRDQVRTLIRPKTPSDHRGPKKHACDIKRALREMGATRA